MKWLFAINEKSRNFIEYSQLIKVSVYSALKNTSLEPYCIYDGGPNELIKWLESYNIPIIKHRSIFYDQLKLLAEEKKNDDIFTIGTGAFLRVEIPMIAQELGWEDKFILYTDCDVMFLKDPVSSMEKMKPQYFSIAPEFDPTDYSKINSGVMIMNLKSLRKDFRAFVNHIIKHMNEYVGVAWDQSAYEDYYKDKWDKLDPVYNWKPYWHRNDSAIIIHFHGPKPTQIEVIKQNQAPEVLINLAKEEYFRLSDIWKKYFEQSDDAATIENIRNQRVARSEKKPFWKRLKF